ncbi:hypothetical protein ANTPLA_LOCUS10517 [Anthophora plagiata]
MAKRIFTGAAYKKQMAFWGSSDIKEGTLVTIRDDNCPPLHWKLGRVVNVHPGSDGVVRVATVRTPHGVYKRSVKKLAPLPIRTI